MGSCIHPVFQGSALGSLRALDLQLLTLAIAPSLEYQLSFLRLKGPHTVHKWQRNLPVGALFCLSLVALNVHRQGAVGVVMEDCAKGFTFLH